MKKSVKVLNILLYLMPMALLFSYYPLIKLGENGVMNFELSVALIWLVVFDLVSLVLMIKEKRLKLKEFLVRKWWWLLFPIFATLSLIWSANLLRGVLTVGVMWLIYWAVFAFFELKDLLDKDFKKNFFRVFFGASLAICVWCFLQCVLDVLGVGKEGTLMCAGCVTEMFGFPHPNGFAVEPQFMGNLLLAPIIVSGVLIIKRISNKKKSAHSFGLILTFFVLVATLFLTFSRGAIYAFAVAMIFLIVMEVVKQKNGRAFLVLPIIILSFVFTLNLQGIFAQVSPTSDTYFSGVAKVLNHLSLGIIDIRAGETKNADAAEEILEEKNEAIFDGYVEESTTVRLELSEAAIKVWSKDLRTILFGVGIGGAGEAMFVAGEIDSPKEIVQNEYVNLLLEVGLVGILLFLLTVILIIKISLKNNLGEVVLTMLVAYGITLLFFSGLPNALQIYLLPAFFLALGNSGLDLNQISLRKKLVS